MNHNDPHSPQMNEWVNERPYIVLGVLPWSPILAAWWGLQGNFSPRTQWGYLGICAFCLWQIVDHIYNLFLACIFSQKHNQLLKENKCYSSGKFWQTTLWHGFQECIVMKSSLLIQTLSKYPQAPSSYTQTSISRATKESNWLPSNTASLAPTFHYPPLCGMRAFPLQGNSLWVRWLDFLARESGDSGYPITKLTKVALLF